MESLLVPGRYMFACGIFYPEGGDYKFEAKRLVVVGQTEHDWRFESGDWWINQIRALAEFYFNAQFPDGVIDYRNYSAPSLTLEGQRRLPSTRQETDTSLADDLRLRPARIHADRREPGTWKLWRKGQSTCGEHMRAIDEEEEIVYWYHAADIQGAHKRNIFASEFGDDFYAIPAYEQIYALAGPIQTYRVTGDPRILRWTPRDDGEPVRPVLP